MKTTQIGAAAVGLAAVLSVIAGCGPSPAKDMQGSMAIVRSDAQKLAPVLRAGRADDKALPSSRAEDEISSADTGFWVQSDRELVYRQTLILSEDRSVFLTWEENALDAPIAGATYSWRSVSGKDNKASRSPVARPVSQDSESGRFFLNLKDVFGDESARLMAQDTQQIEVILRLADEKAAKKVITFFFHVEGQLPVPVASARPVAGWAATAVNDHFGAEEWAVAEDEVANPSPRPLRLWLRYDETAPIEKRMLLVRPTYGQAPGAPPALSAPERRLQTAHYKVRKIQVLRGETVESLPLDSAQWVDVEFKPNERLGVRWIASPAKGTKQCKLEPWVQNFSWAGSCTPPPGNAVPGALIGGVIAGPFGAIVGGALSGQPGSCAPPTERATLTSVFALSGVSVEGAGTRRMAVARESVNLKLEAEAWAVPQEFLTLPTPIAQRAGEVFDPQEPASACQGEL